MRLQSTLLYRPNTLFLGAQDERSRMVISLPAEIIARSYLDIHELIFLSQIGRA